MPRVKVDYVVSFSNEDPENQASNLLLWDVSNKRWLCSPGEPSCSVVLQLARAVKISSVQIGAHHAALVEVLVGRSETPNEPFQVLVPRSVFLSPAASRAGAGAAVARVRSFSGAALPAAAAQRWDRLRIVCSQPYNKHCKFGISFIHIFEPDGEPGSAPPAPAPTASAPAPAPVPAARVPAVPPRVFAMDTFSSDEEEFRPGELFAKYRQSGEDTGAQIRQATSQALKKNPEAATKLVKTTLPRDGKQQPGGRAEPPARDLPARDLQARDLPARDGRKLMYTDDDERPHARIDRLVQRHNDDKRREANTPKPKEKLGETDKVDDTPRSKTEEPSTGRNSVTKRDGDKDNGRETDDARRHARRNGESSSKKKDGDNRKRPHSERDRAETDGALSPGPESERPLDGVVFVLSGYQNPQRARLRDLAASLGARYSRDWGPACTHLICAFSNTPKLLEVRSSANGGSVPIPSAEWILESARARRRLPWQWFAAESARRIARAPPAESARRIASAPPAPPAPAAGNTRAASSRRSSECDTDDDIEEVVRRQKRARISPSPSTSLTQGGGGGAECDDSDEVEFVKDERIQGNITVEDSDSGGETEAEAEATRPPTAGALGVRGALPALFAGRAFVVPQRAPLLARYCRAYGGLLLQPSEVEEDSECIVLCGSEGEVVALAHWRRARRVRAAWVWRCHAARSLLPLDEYALDAR